MLAGALALACSTELAGARGEGAQELERAPYRDAVFAGMVQEFRADESSGLAPSHVRPGVLWTVNDDSGDQRVFAIGTDGAAHGYFQVEGRFVDVEDLATFVWQGKSYLLLADVGMDDKNREERRLIVVEEPPAEDALEGQVLTPKWVVDFDFERPEEDCEAVAAVVNEERNELDVLLLTKRLYDEETHRKFFSLTLESSGKLASPTPVPVAEVEFPELPRFQVPEGAKAISDLEDKWDWYEYRSSPTGMDITPDGLVLVVVTYGSGYVFERKDGTPWSERLTRPPAHLPTPILQQVEAVCFGEGGGASIFLTSERLPTSLYRFDHN